MKTVIVTVNWNVTDYEHFGLGMVTHDLEIDTDLTPAEWAEMDKDARIDYLDEYVKDEFERRISYQFEIVGSRED